VASSTTTHKLANGGPERPNGVYERQAPENRPTADDRKAEIVLGAAVIAMGLVAGLYFFSAIAVMPALTAADDRTLVDAMQQMIIKIENPAFFLVFIGAPALAAVALFQARRSGSPKTAGWIVAGLAFYTVMLVVTFATMSRSTTTSGTPATPTASRSWPQCATTS
jgi:uncharacterized membrane protein